MTEREQDLTVRRKIAELLADRELGVRDLSVELGLSEKEIYGHLEHVARSVRTTGRRLEAEPVLCLACGYTFTGRTRFTRPGRCPRCRRSRLKPPVFRVI